MYLDLATGTEIIHNVSLILFFLFEKHKWYVTLCKYHLEILFATVKQPLLLSTLSSLQNCTASI